MRRLTIPSLLTLPSPAFADVCDKAVGESWMPEDGPVWILNPAGFPSGIVFFTLMVLLVLATKSRVVGILAAALAISYAAIHILDVVENHPVYRAMIREGCRSIPTDLIQIAIFTTFAALVSWLGVRLSKKKDVQAS